MTLPDDGAFFDDVDGDMAEQEAIVAARQIRELAVVLHKQRCPLCGSATHMGPVMPDVEDLHEARRQIEGE